MEEKSLIIFLILTGLIVLVFITGIISFFIRYRRKTKEHENEKILLHEKHQTQILHTQLESQTQTMHHIGREIHDSVGQKLTLASIYLKQLQSNEEKTNNISHIIDESLQELRQLSKSLTDPEQFNNTITDELKKEAAKINATGVCYVTVTAYEAIELPHSARHILFRLIQEFIQNSLKHAACRKINIHLSKKNKLLNIIVKDDGKGFNTEEKSTGIGIYSMKRRADELNAVFQLKSTPGKGTTLDLTINTI